MSDLNASGNAAIPVTTLARSRITTADADLSRALGQGCTAAFTLAGTHSTFELRLVPDATPDWSHSMAMSGSFGDIECADGGRLLRALTGIDIDAADDASGNAAWLHSAIVGRLGATPFACIERLHRVQTQAAGPVIACLTLRGPSHAITTHARASAAAWIAFLRTGSWNRNCTPHDRLEDLLLCRRVRIARHAMPAHALRGLAAGDVVIPDSPAFSRDGAGYVRFGKIALAVRYEAPSSLHILSTEVKLDAHDMDDDYDADYEDEFDEECDDAPEGEVVDNAGNAHPGGGDTAEPTPRPAAPEAGAAGVDSVPVTLDFEMGKACVTVGELRSLGAGSVVMIEDGSPYRITVRAGGRTLGHGEVVDVDGRLGIRLTNWRA